MQLIHCICTNALKLFDVCDTICNAKNPFYIWNTKNPLDSSGWKVTEKKAFQRIIKVRKRSGVFNQTCSKGSAGMMKIKYHYVVNKSNCKTQVAYKQLLIGEKSGIIIWCCLLNLLATDQRMILMTAFSFFHTPLLHSASKSPKWD